MKFGAFLCLIFFGATYCAQYSLEKCESENLCATDYKPICASSGKVQKSFSNDCQLNVFNKCNKMRKFILVLIYLNKIMINF